ncbi:MAG: hypothetical protein OXT74_17425 [Candidatus Poribacteria bacterium]|nr:hypothetical protein [Candidatus Poribacteria bacterium]
MEQKVDWHAMKMGGGISGIKRIGRRNGRAEERMDGTGADWHGV